MIPAPGTRIRLVHTDDPYTRLAPGALGTVTGGQVIPRESRMHSTAIFTVWMAWDDGSTLSLIGGVDAWEVVPTEAAAVAAP